MEPPWSLLEGMDVRTLVPQVLRRTFRRRPAAFSCGEGQEGGSERKQPGMSWRGDNIIYMMIFIFFIFLFVVN